VVADLHLPQLAGAVLAYLIGFSDSGISHERWSSANCGAPALRLPQSRRTVIAALPFSSASIS
jgi:hypothetical protein